MSDDCNPYVLISDGKNPDGKVFIKSCKTYGDLEEALKPAFATMVGPALKGQEPTKVHVERRCDGCGPEATEELFEIDLSEATVKETLADHPELTMDDATQGIAAELAEHTCTLLRPRPRIVFGLGDLFGAFMSMFGGGDGPEEEESETEPEPAEAEAD